MFLKGFVLLNFANDTMFFCKKSAFFQKSVTFIQRSSMRAESEFSSVIGFCKTKSYHYLKCKYCRSCARNPVSGLLQTGHKLEKLTMNPIFAGLTSLPNFWRCRVSLFNFRYLFRLHINIITGSGIIVIFVYKRFTWNL